MKRLDYNSGQGGEESEVRNLQANHIEVIKFIKTQLSQWQFRQASLAVRRFLNKEEDGAEFSNSLFLQSSHVLRQVDLLPKNNTLVAWLRKVEFQLYNCECTQKFSYEIILLIRDYMFPNYLVLSLDHKLDRDYVGYSSGQNEYKKINVCPHSYLFPSLLWFKLFKLNQNNPSMWTREKKEKGGCVDLRGKQDMVLRIFSDQGKEIKWDCYHCPCKTHMFHGHLIDLIRSLKITSFFLYEPKVKKKKKAFPRTPEMILSYLRKYQDALTWEYDNLVGQKKEKGEEELDIEANENFDAAKERFEKTLLQVKKLQKNIWKKVQVWKVSDIFAYYCYLSEPT